MRTRKGVYYFPSFDAARKFSLMHGFPCDRIREYEVGWAIQQYESGPYVGPRALGIKILIHAKNYMLKQEMCPANGQAMRILEDCTMAD